MRRRRFGFSLIEMLVCVAIICILMALYLPILAKARHKAIQVATAAAIGQEHLGRVADNVNIVRPEPEPEPPDREDCRAAYRRTVHNGRQEMLITELLYAVENEAEFRAYWHTLINPSAAGPLEFASGNSVLLAKDENGTEYRLDALELLPNRRPIPVMWEFLSTNMAEMSTANMGITVLYSDGHLEYLRYPSRYPACRTVAELSHRYVQESGL